MPLKTSQEELPSINLTSMIDVLFLLIIFFMVGTRFSENDTSIEVNLPKVANGGAMMPAPKGKSGCPQSGWLHLVGWQSCFHSAARTAAIPSDSELSRSQN
jgi:hypothetical protein